jgi:ABC-type sugar transport system ATPase subunit
MMALLEVRKLTRTDGGRVLLDDVSLEVGAGERVALQGPSGSGKTLLLRSLALLDPLDQGEVLYEGEPVADDEVPGFRRRVVYLTQAPVLVEGTVADNLALPFRLRRAAPPAAEALDGRQFSPTLQEGVPIESRPTDRCQLRDRRAGSGHRDRFACQDSLDDSSSLISEITYGHLAHLATVSRRDTSLPFQLNGQDRRPPTEQA